jgi:hypothetical protein
VDTSSEELVSAIASLTLERLRLLSEVRRLTVEVERLKKDAPRDEPTPEGS